MNDQAAQVFWRFEEPGNALDTDPLLESCELGRAARFHVANFERVVVVHEEDEPWNAADHGPVVLHLGDRKVVASGHIAVAMRDDPQVNVRSVHEVRRVQVPPALG
jgi:hypothetical protein